MKDDGIFYGHLVYFTAIWYILWSFGLVSGQLVCFSSFWYVVHTKKNLAILNELMFFSPV
jgi:hypothetical protein